MKIDPRDGINISMFQLYANSTYVNSNNNPSNQLEIDIKIARTFLVVGIHNDANEFIKYIIIEN